MKKMILLVALVASPLLAQSSPDQSQPGQSSPDQPQQAQPRKTSKDKKVTVQGCVSRASGDFILMQTNPGNSYVLDAPRKIKLDQFLGQQVEVTGVERPTMSSSNNLVVKRAGSSVTIVLDSIKTVAKECGS